jgi:hypothetical protein
MRPDFHIFEIMCQAVGEHWESPVTYKEVLGIILDNHYGQLKSLSTVQEGDLRKPEHCIRGVRRQQSDMGAMGDQRHMPPSSHLPLPGFGS